MGEVVNLHNVMNDVSHRLNHASPVIYAVQRREPLSELQAFAQIDPLLADLQKRYLDARQDRVAMQKEFGHDDGMTEIALLSEDSAWCAMQTRYMELRADRAKMKWAQDLLEEDRLEEEARQEAERKREALKLFHYMRHLESLREQREKTQNDLWLLFLLMFFGWGGFPKNQYPTYSFNRLAA